MGIRLTCKRILNVLRAECSYALSLAKIVHVQHLPTFVSIEPANFCQLHCPECPVGNSQIRSAETGENYAHHERKSVMEWQDYLAILGKISPVIHTLILHWQGEPLLNKNIAEMVRAAKAEGLYVMLSTNGQLLNEELARSLYDAGLDRIVISIDGFSQETYEKYRAEGSLKKAMDSLRHRSAKVIELQTLALRSNESEWPWIRSHFRQLGADQFTLKTAQFYDYENGNEQMPTDSRFCRYQKDKNGRYSLKKNLRILPNSLYPIFAKIHAHSCHRLWTGCVISTSGNVYPCCYDKAHSYPMGNLLTQSLEEVWHSDAANSFRHTFVHGNSANSGNTSSANFGEAFSICRNCIR